MEKGTLPGLERRRQVIAAVTNDRREAMTYTKAKLGKSYRMGSYPSVYFIQSHITPIIYFTNKSMTFSNDLINWGCFINSKKQG